MARPLLLLALSRASLAFATCAGIRLELTHVDAKENCAVPWSAPTAASTGGVTAPVHWGVTQYIAEYLIGDPPQRAEAIIDTGSNLVWTQCSLCRPTSCFSQNLPYYNPSRSRTDRAVGCHDAACALGIETQLSLGFLNGASGIIGLGRGALSLVSQLGDSRFSYCLTPYLRDTINPSHLFVGASTGLMNASDVDAPVTFVPFAKNPKEAPFNTFYYLPLVGMSVGDARLTIPAVAFELRRVVAQPGLWTGGVLIDSGTPFTLLVDVAYRALRAELVRQLVASSLVRPLRGGTPASWCRRCDYWVPADDATDCMALFSSEVVLNRTLPLMKETTIIGNYMQQDMHLLYDLDKGVLSFQPADCSTV
ncbi:Aspartic proteinase nepenthesin-1 [Dichanthelium oligosanthes]|uniref:Aspartic proteinase nepenthesin-1 n=1 Tax=Dichanthelium oligosanthes TaxID=888268 RepID=A0A1E5VCI2_9POAL|nr:Aspartic proteinase nepenthesin-1 [Dichanthelium oligosanthes]